MKVFGMNLLQHILMIMSVKDKAIRKLKKLAPPPQKKMALKVQPDYISAIATAVNLPIREVSAHKGSNQS